VNAYYPKIYMREFLGVWLVCFPMCFQKIVSSESRTLFSIERVCSIGFMNEIISIIIFLKKKKEEEKIYMRERERERERERLQMAVF
jgi:hypothetical protein